MPNQVHTTADLMRAAGNALIKRDAQAIEQLMTTSRDWMQDDSEGDAQRILLESILEAAYLLQDEPSDLPTDEDDEG